MRQYGISLAFLISGMSIAQDMPIKVEAILAGHALIPSDTVINVPSDVPENMQISGKYTQGKRIDTLRSVEGQSAGRPTGQFLPMKGQPLQGHSGIKHMQDGTYWVLTDNGFGKKSNSPDSLLYLNHYEIDFSGGVVKRLETIFLRDPDKKVPFNIVNEATQTRYLTGADFDPESFQIIGDTLWIGDEFGPFLIQADLTGKVLAVFDTLVEGKVVRSPDNPYITTASKPDEKNTFVVSRSKGFEGMGSSPDGRYLYSLLEGALWDSEKEIYENLDGKQYLRILQFDTRTQKWTGKSWQYILEENDHAIGDFNMINETSGLIIERDNREGTHDKACKPGDDVTQCFANPAQFKRVYKVYFDDAGVGKPVEKRAYIDLLDIKDDAKKSLKPLDGGVFVFPFFTIENVDVVNANEIIVGNDNNYPFSSSREPNVEDDNEFILLNVGDMLTQ